MNTPFIANVALAAVSATAAVFQLAVHRGRPSTRFAKWAGLVALGATVFTATNAALHKLPPSELAWHLAQLGYVSIAVICNGVGMVAIELTHSERPALRRALLISTVIGGALVLFTPWVVPPELVPMNLGWADEPYSVVQEGPLTSPFFIWNIGVIGIGVVAMVRWAEPHPIIPLFASTYLFTLVTAVVDSLSTLRIIEEPPMQFAEYGVVAMVLALQSRTLMEHVSLLHQREADLGASVHSFRDLVEHLPDAVLLHRGGHVAYANAAARKLWSRSLVGDPLRGLFGAQCAGSVQAHAGDTRGVEEQWQGRRADGSTFPIEVAGLDTRFDSQPVRLLTVRDISERLRLQASVRALDRMATVGTLAAGAAHEIANPLAYVLGNLELLGEELDEGPLRELVDETLDGAQRIRNIVRDLSSLGKQQHQVRQAVDLSAMVHSAVRITSRQLESCAQVALALEPVPPIEGDPGRLVQLLINLLVNAAQAIGEGRPTLHRITIRLSREGDGAVLSVQDTGPGVPEGLRQRIFEPFVTTKAFDHGTGLGLSICRSIAEDHGGTLEVHSVVEQGSTFTLRVPMAAAAHGALPAQLSQV